MLQKRNRIIIDTNLWISYLLKGGASALDSIIESNSVVLLFSDELLEEFIDVAVRPKFRKYFSTEDLISLLHQIEVRGEFVKVESSVQVCRDPKDNFLLALAKDAQATHLLTGDDDLISIGTFELTKILTITDFIDEWKK